MKNLFPGYRISVFIILCLALIFSSQCKKGKNPIKFAFGTFPDSVINLADINSEFDDYNTDIYQIKGYLPLLFSSNRKSSGGQFDLEQGMISFSFDQTNGDFILRSEMTNDAFLNSLIQKAQTSRNDFGPYSLFSSFDGYEYFVVSSENADGNLDLLYFKNLPAYGGTVPVIEGPHPVTLLNTGYDDAYLTFDSNQDTAYFISNPDANFDIYFKSKPASLDLASWFNLDYSASAKVDSINTLSDDKCPMVYHNLMVFTSNRPGGYGGYDLYYSLFRNGNWNSPVNFGPGINSTSDEYRPLIGNNPDFSNLFLIFSSDRPGGKGGFDLYFTGIDYSTQ